MMAGRSTLSSASVSTGMWAPADTPIPTIAPGSTPASRTAWGTARHSASNQESGSCSDQPNFGIDVSIGQEASPATRPASSTTVALRLPAPRSMPRR
jgi:hypothetical protein